jgi:uncharacterized membrane protein YbjE (DUF340 family)
MWYKGKHVRHIDYYGWFVIGIVWSAVGIVNVIFGGKENAFFLVMGLAFCLGGLLHKKSWKENRREWEKLDKRHSMIMIISSIVLAIVIAALVAYAVLKR